MDKPLVKISEGVAIRIVRSNSAEVRKGSRGIALSSGLVDPKSVRKRVQKYEHLVALRGGVECFTDEREKV